MITSEAYLASLSRNNNNMLNSLSEDSEPGDEDLELATIQTSTYNTMPISSNHQSSYNSSSGSATVGGTGNSTVLGLPGLSSALGLRRDAGYSALEDSSESKSNRT